MSVARQTLAIVDKRQYVHSLARKGNAASVLLTDEGKKMCLSLCATHRAGFLGMTSFNGVVVELQSCVCPENVSPGGWGPGDGAWRALV